MHVAFFLANAISPPTLEATLVLVLVWSPPIIEELHHYTNIKHFKLLFLSLECNVDVDISFKFIVLVIIHI